MNRRGLPVAVAHVVTLAVLCAAIIVLHDVVSDAVVCAVVAAAAAVVVPVALEARLRGAHYKWLASELVCALAIVALTWRWHGVGVFAALTAASVLVPGAIAARALLPDQRDHPVVVIALGLALLAFLGQAFISVLHVDPREALLGYLALALVATSLCRVQDEFAVDERPGTGHAAPTVEAHGL